MYSTDFTGMCFPGFLIGACVAYVNMHYAFPKFIIVDTHIHSQY